MLNSSKNQPRRLRTEDRGSNSDITYDPRSSILHARFTWSIATSFLLGRGRQLSFLVAGVITAPRSRDQFAAALRIDAHLDVAERAVALVVGRVIADDVLRAQVFGDLSGDGRNLADGSREIGAPAGIVGDAREQFLGLLRGRFPEEALLFHLFVNEADQIDLDLVLLDRLHHFLLFDRTVLLQTVRDHDQGLAAALALLLRVIGGGDDRVKQRRAAARIEIGYGVLEFAPVGREILHQFMLGFERSDKGFVVNPHLLDQRDRGVRHRLELRPHTARRVNHQPETDGHLFAVDIFNRLFDPVLVNGEILFLEIHNREVVLIDHRHVQLYQVRLDFDRVLFIPDLLVGLRALTPVAFLIPGVLSLRGLLRLRGAWRVLRAGAADGR